MLLQIKYRLNEKKQIEEEKDNISLSSGESVKDKSRSGSINNDESSSSDSEGDTYLKIKSFKNNKKEGQSKNLLPLNPIKPKDNKMNINLNENQQSNQDQLDSKNLRAKRRNFIW